MSLLYATLLVLTTLFWGTVFYKKDYHPQPLRVVLLSFGVGLFSMIPVFVYRTLYQQWLPGLSEFRVFRPLLDSPLLAGLMAFLMNLVLLSVVLFLVSGILSLILNFFSHAAIANLKSALRQEPLGFTTVSLLIGLVILAKQWAEGLWGSTILVSAMGSILFLAIIEEYVKHLVVRVTDDRRLGDIDDAITLSIMVGLAFALVETVIYAFSAGEMKIIFYRTLVSLPVHVVASGLFGYHYGLAHFAKPIVAMGNGEKTYHTHLWGVARHGWLHRLMTLKRSTVYGEEKIMEGFLFATAFHAAMNVLFELSLGFVAVPPIVLGVWLVSSLYKKGQRETRMIEKKLALKRA